MISIDFAGGNYRLRYRVRAGLIIGSVLLVILIAGMLWKTVSLHANISVVERELTERRSGLDDVRPLLVERARLMKELSGLSGITAARRFSWTELLTALEAVVPVGTKLTSVKFNPETSALSLEGAARSPESLQKLVIDMEQSERFTEPMLKQQTLEKGTISFNVVAVYRQNAGPALAHGGK